MTITVNSAADKTQKRLALLALPNWRKAVNTNKPLLAFIAFMFGCTGSGGSVSPQPMLNLETSRLAVGVFTDRIATGDFNGDGRADLLTSSSAANTISTLLGNGDGTFQPPMSSPSGPRTIHVAVGDLNNDSKLDLVVVHQSANEIAIRLGSGDGTFPPLVSYPVADGPYWSALGDFDKDGRPDIAVTTLSGVSVLLAKSGGIFWPSQRVASGLNPSSLKVADFNGDSIDDIVVSNIEDPTIAVLLCNGNGTFSAPLITTSSETSGQQEVAVGDIDGDGLLDLATTNHRTNSVNFLFGKGDGTFQAPSNAIVGTGPYGLALADLDLDDLTDIVTANNGSNDIGVLRGNGGGAFSPHIAFVAGREPVYLVVGDWNEDRRPDVAVALASESAVGVLINASK